MLRSSVHPHVVVQQVERQQLRVHLRRGDAPWRLSTAQRGGGKGGHRNREDSLEFTAAGKRSP